MTEALAKRLERFINSQPSELFEDLNSTVWFVQRVAEAVLLSNCLIDRFDYSLQDETFDYTSINL